MRLNQADGIRSSLSGDASEMIPSIVSNALITKLGKDAIPVLEEMAIVLQEDKESPPPLLSYMTQGENINIEPHVFGTIRGEFESYRPDDSLSYDRIEKMLENGQVVFGLEMKKSWIRSAFRNKESWRIDCPEEKVSDAVRPMVDRILQRHSNDFMEALVYGSYFGEKIFDRQPAKYWGLEGNGNYVGYHSVEPVYPPTVTRILYEDGQAFDGYVQQKRHGDEVRVPADRSLVLTYDKRFRNLWGKSILEPVYSYWAWYEIALRSMLRFLERMGTPVTVCYAPSRGSIRDKDGSVVRTMKYAFLVASNVAKTNAMAIPSDVDPDTGKELWRVEYLNAPEKGNQFMQAVNYLGTQIVRSLVIGDRTAMQPSGEAGSYGSSETHFAVTMLHNEHILTQFIEQFNGYLIPQLVRYNFGQGSPPAQMVTEGLDVREKDRLFQLLNTMGNQAYSQAFRYVDWRSIMSINNIPTLSEEDVKKLEDKEIERKKKEAEITSTPPQEESLEKKAMQSSDYMLYEIASGKLMPVILTEGQAEEISDRYGERPFVLHNPYHDELGRFTTADRVGSGKGVASDIAEWAKEHKTELIIGGVVVLAAVAAGAYVYYGGRCFGPGAGGGIKEVANNVIEKAAQNVAGPAGGARDVTKLTRDQSMAAVHKVKNLESEWSVMYNMRKRWQTVFHSDGKLFEDTVRESAGAVKIVDRDDLRHFTPRAVHSLLDDGEAVGMFKKAITRGYLEYDGDVIRVGLDSVDISLHNPYHDELGRFTTAERAEKGGVLVDKIKDSGFSTDAAKQWVKDHKKELIIGGAILGTAAVIGLGIYLSSDHSTLVHSLNYDGLKVDVKTVASGWDILRGNVEKPTVDALSNVARSVDTIRSQGVDVTGARSIVLHPDLDTFGKVLGDKELAKAYDGFVKHAGKLGLKKIGKVAHVSPDVTRALASPKLGERALASSVIQHELFHMRDATLAKGFRLVPRLEEPMADHFAVKGAKSLWGEHAKDVPYAFEEMRKPLLEAAGSYAMRYGVSVEDAIMKFVNWTNQYDVFNVLSESPDELIELHNPYHDELGRFTTAARARSGLLPPNYKTQEMSGHMQENFKIILDEEGNRTAIFKEHTDEEQIWPYNLWGGKAENFRGGKGIAGREVAASMVAKNLGMDDFVANTEWGKVEGKEGSVQEWISGTTVFKLPFITIPAQNRRRMAVFDYLIGNVDRHTRNMLWEGGKVYAIDNGYSFPDLGGNDFRKYVAGLANVKPYAPPIPTSSERDAIRKMLDDSNFIKSLEPMIGAGAASDFVKRAEVYAS